MTRQFMLLNIALGLLLAFLVRRQGADSDTHATTPQPPADAPQHQSNVEGNSVRAAFVVLVRNSELFGMKRAMRQIEDRYNSRFNYPYVFLNDVPFTEEFKVETAAMTRANVTFGIIPHEHWSYPAWINKTYARECRQKMSKQGVFYALNESYRHMCRFNSGFFFRHPLLREIDYYWRIEPDVEYSCNIDYDPFLYMHRNGIKYGYTIALHEYPETIPTLWSTVKDFIALHPDFVRHKNGYKWLSNDDGASYNGCHFWSNFEIGALSLFRSPEYLEFFDYLDKAGGFFYERWGDAPVHSIAAALLLEKKELHWFQDIGYYHNPWTNCPLDKESRLRCHCDPAKSAVHHYWASCTKEWVELADGTNLNNSSISDPAKEITH
ncbi:hypothetical protein IWW48_000137 [Coemansia sp. RSA 1200]|nr:hypothetical protein IWW48_000137 [Coemansia sp. RSA 1200]